MRATVGAAHYLLPQRTGTQLGTTTDCPGRQQRSAVPHQCATGRATHKGLWETLTLKAGLTLEADVLQERRKVWEWVLEPVLAARQQVKVLNADPNKVREGG